VGKYSIESRRMAAKTKCLAANNKRRTTQSRLSQPVCTPVIPHHPVVQIGAASGNCCSGAVPYLSMASPTYGLDVVALAFAFVLAARPRASIFPPHASSCRPDAASVERDGFGHVYVK
jgi:hypothetical protein